MNRQNYLSKVQGIFLRRGWTRDVSPASLLRDWEAFVELCARGYPNNIYEYYNDIRVREWIELILSSPELKGFIERDEFDSSVAEVDERFKSLLTLQISIPGRSFWWERGVLKYAGEELANDSKKQYGIEIPIIGR